MNADDYPHRELFLAPDPDARICTVLLDHGHDVTALDIDMMRDLIADRVHVLIAAADAASLSLACASFRRLVEQAPAASNH